MVILDISVSILGRFRVSDAYDLTPVKLQNGVTTTELNTISNVAKSKANDYTPPIETIIATLATLYGMTNEDVTIHTEKPVKLVFEPEI